MRRLFTICIAAGLMLAPIHPAAAAAVPVSEICRFQGSDGNPRVSIEENERIVRCAFRRFAPGLLDDAWPIAIRESGFNTYATNPNVASACKVFTSYSYGSCGTFQHLSRYWLGRLRAWTNPAWFHSWPVGPLNARANAFVTARMFAAGQICHWQPPRYCG